MYLLDPDHPQKRNGYNNLPDPASWGVDGEPERIRKIRIARLQQEHELLNKSRNKTRNKPKITENPFMNPVNNNLPWNQPPQYTQQPQWSQQPPQQQQPQWGQQPPQQPAPQPPPWMQQRYPQQPQQPQPQWNQPPQQPQWVQQQPQQQPAPQPPPWMQQRYPQQPQQPQWGQQQPQYTPHHPQWAQPQQPQLPEYGANNQAQYAGAYGTAPKGGGSPYTVPHTQVPDVPILPNTPTNTMQYVDQVGNVYQVGSDTPPAGTPGSDVPPVLMDVGRVGLSTSVVVNGMNYPREYQVSHLPDGTPRFLLAPESFVLTHVVDHNLALETSEKFSASKVLDDLSDRVRVDHMGLDANTYIYTGEQVLCNTVDGRFMMNILYNSYYGNARLAIRRQSNHVYILRDDQGDLTFTRLGSLIYMDGYMYPAEDDDVPKANGFVAGLNGHPVTYDHEGGLVMSDLEMDGATSWAIGHGPELYWHPASEGHPIAQHYRIARSNIAKYHLTEENTRTGMYNELTYKLALEYVGGINGKAVQFDIGSDTIAVPWYMSQQGQVSRATLKGELVTVDGHQVGTVQESVFVTKDTHLAAMKGIPAHLTASTIGSPPPAMSAPTPSENYTKKYGGMEEYIHQQPPVVVDERGAEVDTTPYQSAKVDVLSPSFWESPQGIQLEEEYIQMKNDELPDYYAGAPEGEMMEAYRKMGFGEWMVNPELPEVVPFTIDTPQDRIEMHKDIARMMDETTSGTVVDQETGELKDESVTEQLERETLEMIDKQPKGATHRLGTLPPKPEPAELTPINLDMSKMEPKPEVEELPPAKPMETITESEIIAEIKELSGDSSPQTLDYFRSLMSNVDLIKEKIRKTKADLGIYKHTDIATSMNEIDVLNFVYEDTLGGDSVRIAESTSLVATPVDLYQDNQRDNRHQIYERLLEWDIKTLDELAEVLTSETRAHGKNDMSAYQEWITHFDNKVTRKVNKFLSDYLGPQALWIDSFKNEFGELTDQIVEMDFNEELPDGFTEAMEKWSQHTVLELLNPRFIAEHNESVIPALKELGDFSYDETDVGGDRVIMEAIPGLTTSHILTLQQEYIIQVDAAGLGFTNMIPDRGMKLPSGQAQIGGYLKYLVNADLDQGHIVKIVTSVDHRVFQIEKCWTDPKCVMVTRLS